MLSGFQHDVDGDLLHPPRALAPGAELHRGNSELVVDIGVRPDARPIGSLDLQLLAKEVLIDLLSPSGHAALWVADADVTQFLAATYQLVPAGTEADHINWARELPNLLERRLFMPDTYTVPQAAQVLGCTPGTVKSQTAKALDSLRRAMGGAADAWLAASPARIPST